VKARQEKGELERRITDFLDLPKEVFLDLPKITLLGNMQLFIENHYGIIEYAPGIIRISSKKGEIIVTGTNLVIETILAEEINIAGKIQEIKFTD